MTPVLTFSEINRCLICQAALDRLFFRKFKTWTSLSEKLTSLSVSTSPIECGLCPALSKYLNPCFQPHVFLLRVET